MLQQFKECCDAVMLKLHCWQIGKNARRLLMPGVSGKVSRLIHQHYYLYYGSVGSFNLLHRNTGRYRNRQNRSGGRHCSLTWQYLLRLYGQEIGNERAAQ